MFLGAKGTALREAQLKLMRSCKKIIMLFKDKKQYIFMKN
jgi:hypothetical protein